MPRSSLPTNVDDKDYTLELQKFLEEISEKEPVVSEIEGMGARCAPKFKSSEPLK